MKRILTIITALLLVVSLNACSAGSKTKYTYEWSQPKFTAGSISKSFDDFDITYPSDWVTVESVPGYDISQFLLMIKKPSNTGLFTNMNIAQADGKAYFKEEGASKLAKQIGEAYGITLAVDDVRYGMVNNKEMEFIYLSGTYNGIKLAYIAQIVIHDSATYIFTYTILNEQARDEAVSIANSVKFK